VNNCSSWFITQCSWYHIHRIGINRHTTESIFSRLIHLPAFIGWTVDARSKPQHLPLHPMDSNCQIASVMIQWVQPILKRRQIDKVFLSSHNLSMIVNKLRPLGHSSSFEKLAAFVVDICLRWLGLLDCKSSCIVLHNDLFWPSQRANNLESTGLYWYD
jgi:hypothetical protein